MKCLDRVCHYLVRHAAPRLQELTVVVSVVPILVSCSIAGAAVNRFPDYDTLAKGPWPPILLSGQRGFVFTMYGAPSDLDSLRRVVTIMQEKDLGNGFDPGPAAQAVNKPVFDYLAGVGWPVIAYPGRADMQVKGGCALGAEDEAALAALDQAGIFNAVQLGEWGYYFHNLTRPRHSVDTGRNRAGPFGRV